MYNMCIVLNHIVLWDWRIYHWPCIWSLRTSLADLIQCKQIQGNAMNCDWMQCNSLIPNRVKYELTRDPTQSHMGIDRIRKIWKSFKVFNRVWRIISACLDGDGSRSTGKSCSCFSKDFVHQTNGSPMQCFTRTFEQKGAKKSGAAPPQ